MEILNHSNVDFKSAVEKAIKEITSSMIFKGPFAEEEGVKPMGQPQPVCYVETGESSRGPEGQNSAAAEDFEGGENRRDIHEGGLIVHMPALDEVGGLREGEVVSNVQEEETDFEGDDRIGALDGVGIQCSDSEGDFEMRVKALTPGFIDSIDTDDGDRTMDEVKRKSKRQLDRWGAKGPSEGDLIRSAAKAREPTSACGGHSGPRKRGRGDGEG